MTDPASTLIEYRLAAAERHINAQDAEIAALHRDIDALRRETEATERKRLLWGISALGSVIIALAGVIWSYRAVIFK